MTRVGSIRAPHQGLRTYLFTFQTASFDTVIASEAKQSMDVAEKSGLLRRFAPRNDVKHSFAISPRIPREVCQERRAF